MFRLLEMISSVLIRHPDYSDRQRAGRESEAFMRAYLNHQEITAQTAPVLSVTVDAADADSMTSYTEIQQPRHVKKKLISEECYKPNILTENTVVGGDIETTGDLRLDGRVEGNISSSGTVVIGLKGCVHGEVSVRVLELYGSVYGNCTVAEVLIMRCTSRLNGDVTAQSMLVEKGAVFTGRASVCVREDHIQAMTEDSREAVCSEHESG